MGNSHPSQRQNTLNDPEDWQLLFGTDLSSPSTVMVAGKSPLRFHRIKGDNVTLDEGRKVASRGDSFCKGLCFSDRPIDIGEVVCIKLVEVSIAWSGVLRVGVTNTDPKDLANNLPKYACPDLSNKPGNWAKAVPDKICLQSTVLQFWLNASGEMFYAVNGINKGIFLSGILVDRPTWILIDIYGNTHKLEFMDLSELRHLVQQAKLANNEGSDAQPSRASSSTAIENTTTATVTQQSNSSPVRALAPSPPHLTLNNAKPTPLCNLLTSSATGLAASHTAPLSSNETIRRRPPPPIPPPPVPQSSRNNVAAIQQSIVSSSRSSSSLPLAGVAAPQTATASLSSLVPPHPTPQRLFPDVVSTSSQQIQLSSTNPLLTTSNSVGTLTSSSVTTITLQPPRPTAPPSRFYSNVQFTALKFHSFTGRFANLDSEKASASRVPGRSANGYVFSCRPISVNEKVIIQVMSVSSPSAPASLLLGFTTCDPVRLLNRHEILPDDPFVLLDRSEYWVFLHDAVGPVKPGDELAFYYDSYGAVHFQRNQDAVKTVMHIEHTQSPFIFFDFVNATDKIRLLGTLRAAIQPHPVPGLTMGSDTELSNRLHAAAPINAAISSGASAPTTPQHASFYCGRSSELRSLSNAALNPAANSQVAAASASRMPAAPARSEMVCTVCQENPLETIIRPCKHACLCSKCAESIKNRGALCPMCRGPITEIDQIFLPY